MKIFQIQFKQYADQSFDIIDALLYYLFLPFPTKDEKKILKVMEVVKGKTIKTKTKMH